MANFGRISYNDSMNRERKVSESQKCDSSDLLIVNYGDDSPGTWMYEAISVMKNIITADLVIVTGMKWFF